MKPQVIIRRYTMKISLEVPTSFNERHKIMNNFNGKMAHIIQFIT